MDATIKDGEKITLPYFKEITMSKSSEMFLCVYLLLRSQIPFFKQLPSYAKIIKKKEDPTAGSPHTSTFFPSPRALRKFQHVAGIAGSPKGKGSPLSGEPQELKKNSLLMQLSGDKSTKEEVKKSEPIATPSAFIPIEENKGEITKKPKRVPAQPIEITKTAAADPIMSPMLNTEVVRMSNSIGITGKSKEIKKDLLMSPSLFLRETPREAMPGMNFCACGKQCLEGNIQCPNCMQTHEGTEFSGYLYNKSKTKMKRYWYQLLNKELFCFKNKDDTTHKRMYSLTSTFIKEELEDIFDKKTVLYPFSLYFLHNKKTFYAFKKEDKIAWIKYLKQAIGYSNLYDYYELKVNFYFSSKYLVKIGKWKIWSGKIGDS